MKTEKEVFDDVCAETGIINYMNGVRMIQLKQWTYTALERVIWNAMRANAQERTKEYKKVIEDALETLGHKDGDYAVGEGNIKDACIELQKMRDGLALSN